MPENIRGDVHVTAQGVRWTYLGSRYPGAVDVTIQPPGEEPSDHTVMWVVWDAVVSGSKPLGRVAVPPESWSPLSATDFASPEAHRETLLLTARICRSHGFDGQAAALESEARS